MKTESEKSDLGDEVLNAAWMQSPDSGHWIFDVGWLLFITAICAIWKAIRKRRRAKTESASEPKQEGN